MNQKKIIIPLLFVLLVGFFSLFTVQEWQQAIVFQFREIKRADIAPGLRMLIPFANTVQLFDQRLLNLSQESQRFLTKEKKDVIVDYYVKWRITNMVKFYESTKGNILSASRLLEQRINRALRDEFGERTVQEVVAGERNEILEIVTNTTAGLQKDLGISVIDVRTKRIDLPDEVSNSVYSRMRAERNRVAKGFRARGSEAAERIRADADKEREIILSNAYRDAEIIRGEGDASATEIYAMAYENDADFYSFYRSLDAYKKSFGQKGDILLIDSNSEFFRFFGSQQGD